MTKMIKHKNYLPVATVRIGKVILAAAPIAVVDVVVAVIGDETFYCWKASVEIVGLHSPQSFLKYRHYLAYLVQFVCHTQETGHYMKFLGQFCGKPYGVCCSFITSSRSGSRITRRR
jgi:hypothetical protein